MHPLHALHSIQASFKDAVLDLQFNAYAHLSHPYRNSYVFRCLRLTVCVHCVELTCYCSRVAQDLLNMSQSHVARWAVVTVKIVFCYLVSVPVVIWAVHVTEQSCDPQPVTCHLLQSMYGLRCELMDKLVYAITYTMKMLFPGCYWKWSKLLKLKASCCPQFATLLETSL